VSSTPALRQDLATRAIALQNAIATQEQILEGKKAELKTILENELPEAMRAAEVETFAHDGYAFTYERNVYGGMPADIAKNSAARKEIFTWLRANGAGSIIKTEVTASLGALDAETVENFMQMLRASLIEFDIQVKLPQTHKRLTKIVMEVANHFHPAPVVEQHYAVNGSALKAFIKRRLEAGEPVPSVFKLYTPQEVKVEPSISGDAL
jgi:hypothetical protein